MIHSVLFPVPSSYLYHSTMPSGSALMAASRRTGLPVGTLETFVVRNATGGRLPMTTVFPAHSLTWSYLSRTLTLTVYVPSSA